jgi:hypothetical protein
VWTRVIDRTVVDYEEVGFGRRHAMNRMGVPVYSVQGGGTVSYTLAFEYLTMRTGYFHTSI